MTAALTQGARIPRRHAMAGLLTSSAGIEWALTCAMLLPLLFINQLWTLGAALFIFFALVYFLVHQRELVVAFLNRWPLLLAPAFFLSSVLWSDYPAITLKQAVMVGVSMAAGFALSASRRPGAVIGGIFTAFAIFMLVSVGMGGWVMSGSFGTGYGSDWSFAGLNGRKNLMGATAAMSLLASLGALAVFIRARSALGSLAAMGLLGLSAFALVASHSAGAMVGACIAFVAFCALALVGRMRPLGRAVAGGVFALVMVLVALFARTLADVTTSTVLRVFQKDPTFTGRSYIWYRAQDFIGERPLLGRGFGAFWIQGNPDAEGLWRFGQITERMGFSFHNSMTELLVHVGWIGAILLLGLFVVAAVLLVRRVARAPDAAGCFYLSFVIYQLALSPFESVGAPAPFDVANLVLMIALGYGFRPFGGWRPAAASWVPARPPALRTHVVAPLPIDPGPAISYARAALPAGQYLANPYPQRVRDAQAP